MEQDLAIAPTVVLPSVATVPTGAKAPGGSVDLGQGNSTQETPTIQHLKPLWDMLRPRDGEEAGERLDSFIEALSHDDQLLDTARVWLGTFLRQTDLVHALAESGILPRRTFLTGLMTRVGERVLPRPRSEDDLRGALRLLFEPRDWLWVRDAGIERWARLLDLLVPEGEHLSLRHDDVAAAMRGLAQRIGALGIDEEINARVPEVADYDSPFLNLTHRVHAFVDRQRIDEDHEDAWQELVGTMEACHVIVERLDSGRQNWGTSLNLTVMARRLHKQFSRLELLARLRRARDRDDYVAALATLFVDIVEAEQTSREVRRYVRESVDLHIFQIVEETASKGEKYATPSKKGYWKFLRAALQGGAIVAFFALVKLWLTHLHLPLGLQALAYSVNYAVCFVLIYLSGSILATKQPAVTASALTRRLDRAADRNVSLEGVADMDVALEGVADMVVVVWRSQFVSFVGNLVAAFPLAMLFSYILTKYHVEIVDGDKAASLVRGVRPFKSFALYYAAVAGFFLFAAGLLAGIVQNRATYTDLEGRLGAALSRFGGRGSAIASYANRHLGMIVGNVSLGFALGCAGPLGEAFNIPFDIRHIAFSSANMGVVANVEPDLFARPVIVWSILGVLGIGLVNFLVSFGLTLGMALESRQVSLKENEFLLHLLAIRALRSPMSWFFPTSGGKLLEDDEELEDLDAASSAPPSTTAA